MFLYSLQLWTVEIPLHQHDSGCTRAHIINLQQSSPHLHTFHYCVCQEVKTVSAHPKPGPNQFLVYNSPGLMFNRRNPVHAQTQTHTPILFLYARRSDVVVNYFRWYVGYGDAHKHMSVCVCWYGRGGGWDEEPRLRLTLAVA